MINDSCTTLPVSIYTINASVTFMNGSQTNYVSNNIMDTLGDSMGRFIVSYNDHFDEALVPNTTYVFTVNSDNPPSPPTDNPPAPPTDCKYFVLIAMYVRTLYTSILQYNNLRHTIKKYQALMSIGHMHLYNYTPSF